MTIRQRGVLPLFLTYVVLSLILFAWSFLMALAFSLSWLFIVLFAVCTYHFFTLTTVYRRVVLISKNKESKFWLGFALLIFAVSFSFLFHVGIGLFCAVFLPLFFSRNLTESEGTETIRGKGLDDLTDVRREIAKSLKPGKPTITIGTVDYPVNVLGRNAAAVGQIGTGKTTLFRQIMQQILPTITAENGKLAVIADYKQEMGSILEGLKQQGRLHVPVIYLHPYDTRCAAPDFSSFIIDEADAAELANLIIPENKESKDPYWDNNARNRIMLATEYFQLHGEEEWYLHDVLNSASNPALEKNMVAADNYLSDRYRNTFGDEELESKHLNTLSSHTPTWKSIAGLWQQASQKIDIDEICEKGGCILVIGYDAKATQTVNKLNRLILNRIIANIMNSPNGEGDLRTFLFLDEFGNLGKLDRISELFTAARSKLTGILIGLQAYSQLVETYGERLANTISGMCEVKIILRVTDNQSSEWAGNLFGRTEDMDTIININIDADGRQGQAINRNINVRQVVLPNQIQTLPTIKNNGVMGGYYIVNGKAYKAHEPAKQVFARMLPKAEPEAEYNFLDIRKMRDKESRRRTRYSKPWTDKDLIRLNIAHLMPVREIDATLENESLPPGASQFDVLDTEESLDLEQLREMAEQLEELKDSAEDKDLPEN